MDFGATSENSFCVQVAVEIGHDLAHDVDPDALAAQRPDLRVDGLSGARKLGDRGRAVDAPRDQL